MVEKKASNAYECNALIHMQLLVLSQSDSISLVSFRGPASIGFEGGLFPSRYLTTSLKLIAFFVVRLNKTGRGEDHHEIFNPQRSAAVFDRRRSALRVLRRRLWAFARFWNSDIRIWLPWACTPRFQASSPFYFQVSSRSFQASSRVIFQASPFPQKTSLSPSFFCGQKLRPSRAIFPFPAFMEPPASF